jgi:hypothetical protein
MRANEFINESDTEKGKSASKTVLRKLSDIARRKKVAADAAKRTFNTAKKTSQSQQKESFGNKTFKVLIKFADPSGNGIASKIYSFKSIRDAEHAKYVALLRANEQGLKNAKVTRAVEIPNKDIAIDEKTIPKLCRSTKRLGRSDYSSCVAQGLRPHQSKGKGHTDGHGNYLKGKKSKTVRYGGPVNDYSGK